MFSWYRALQLGHDAPTGFRPHTEHLSGLSERRGRGTTLVGAHPIRPRMDGIMIARPRIVVLNAASSSTMWRPGTISAAPSCMNPAPADSYHPITVVPWIPQAFWAVNLLSFLTSSSRAALRADPPSAMLYRW